MTRYSEAKRSHSGKPTPCEIPAATPVSNECLAGLRAPVEIESRQQDLPATSEQQLRSSTSREPSVEALLKQVGDLPLLSIEEEIALGNRRKEIDHIIEALGSKTSPGCRGEPRPSKALQFSKLESERLEIISTFVERNVRLAICIASQFQHSRISFSTLVSAALLGTQAAAERFDPDKGAKFSTYASFWIRQHIQRTLTNEGSLIRIPAHLRERIIKITRTANNISPRNNKSNGDSEILRLTGLTIEQLRSAREAASISTVSLHQPLSADSDDTLESILPSEGDGREWLAAAIKEEDRANLYAALKVLSPKERKVIERRFGLNKNQVAESLEEVGNDFHLSRERIRQIQEKALIKLRRALPRPLA